MSPTEPDPIPPKPVQNVLAACVIVCWFGITWFFSLCGGITMPKPVGDGAFLLGLAWSALLGVVVFVLGVRRVFRDPTDRVFAALYLGLPVSLLWLGVTYFVGLVLCAILR
ncbi:MAG: hypothetical protein ACRC7O_01540 [Fimbriiglobus sp.]